MTDKEIIEDINYRIRKSDTIKKLEEDVTEGIYDENPLIDLVLYYKRDIEQLEEENERLYKKIKYLQDVMKGLGELSQDTMTNDSTRG